MKTDTKSVTILLLITNFREILEAQGAEVICYDEKMDYVTVEHVNKPTHDQTNHFSILLSLVSEAIEDMIENYLDDIRNYQPHVIVGDSLAFWASIIANKLAISCVSSNTHFAFNKHTPTMLSHLTWPDSLALLIQSPKIIKHYKKIKGLGYKTRHVTDLSLTREDIPVIVTTSQEFQPTGDTFGDNIFFTGPIIRDSLTTWSKKDRPLIYISLGTVNNQASAFYQNCFKALADKPFDVVLSVGVETDIESLGIIPSNITVTHKVDQIAILKEADVFLTHCGLNSTSEALYYEVPLLVFPQTDEQSIVANQVLTKGAGIKLKNTQPKTIATGIDILLNDNKYRAKASQIARTFKASGGVEKAEQVILDYCL